MFISSIFCSSDIIAAITIVKFEEQPKLFSIILGEGLFNDAVAIILFETTKSFLIGEDGKNREFDYKTPFEVLSEFV